MAKAGNSENFYGSKSVLNWGYCYGLRLRNYLGINQIDKVVEKLNRKPESKSATIVIMDPKVDFNGHMPCIVTLDFKIREGKLLATAFFRSQDVGKKMYADILSLGKIQKEVGEKTRTKPGKLKIFISSAHIYETEFNKVKELLQNVN